MSQQGNSGSVFMAFVIGAVAGAAVALLYAPAPGDETRRKLAEKAREGRARAEQYGREGREFVGRQRENVVAAVDQAVEKGRDVVDRGREAIERGREAFDRARKEHS
jgi:gas vesicle protein